MTVAILTVVHPLKYFSFWTGILPHDGKNIKFNELSDKLRAAYNFAPSFCFFVPNYAANTLKKNYRKDTFDLADINFRNAVEHDASLTRKYCFDLSLWTVTHLGSG